MVSELGSSWKYAELSVTWNYFKLSDYLREGSIINYQIFQLLFRRPSSMRVRFQLEVSWTKYHIELFPTKYFLREESIINYKIFQVFFRRPSGIRTRFQLEVFKTKYHIELNTVEQSDTKSCGITLEFMGDTSRIRVGYL